MSSRAGAALVRKAAPTAEMSAVVPSWANASAPGSGTLYQRSGIS